MFNRRQGRIFKQLYADAIALIHQRRIGFQQQPAGLACHLFGQLTTGPVLQAILLQLTFTQFADRVLNAISKLLPELIQIASLTNHLPFVVDNTNVHEQVWVEALSMPMLFQKTYAGHAGQLSPKHFRQRFITGRQRLQCSRDIIRHRHKVLAHRFGHGTHQRHTLVKQHTRHQPLQTIFRQQLQGFYRHRQRNTVIHLARGKVIAQRQFQTIPAQSIRVPVNRHLSGIVFHQVLFGQMQ